MSQILFSLEKQSNFNPQGGKMKKILLLTIALFTTSIASAGNYGDQYKVTFTNVTKGQPLTPPVIAIHDASVVLFKLGEEASEGLKALAKDGQTDLILQELTTQTGVLATAKGTAPVLPGQSAEVIIASDKKGVLSLASMLGRTNDAFAAGRFLHLPGKTGVKITYLLGVYDAGAEINTEACSDIPAPPCSSPKSGPAEGEGFVTSHPGVYGIADLTVLRDTFGKVAAKVVIEKM